MCFGCVGDLFGQLDNLRPGTSRRAFIAESLAAAGAGMAAIATAASAHATGSPAPSGADLIFHGGTVIPLAGADRSAEALAVSGGKILRVGSKAAVMGLKTGATRVIDLDGRTMLPGFIDPHQHTMTGALVSALFTDIGYAKYPTRQAMLAAMRDRAAKTPQGKWLYFYNFDNLLQGGDLSFRDLDTVTTAHPVMVYYVNMHTASVNRAALDAAHIPETIGVLPGGGHFGRDGGGKLDGMVYEEPALRKFLAGLPPITPQFAGKAMLDWLAANAAAGNTTVHEPGVLVFGNLLQGYERVAAQSPCRASISLMFDSMDKGEVYRQYGRGARATQVPGTLLSLYAIKIIGDGSNQTKTAAQTLAYLGGTDKGLLNYDAAEMKRMVGAVRAAGWPVCIHANGDATLDVALDAIEAAYGAHPPTGVNRIEHCTIARPDQIARMKRLGVQPSFLMNHVRFYGAAYRDALFGPARAERMDAAADCVNAGIPFTLHTDAPCSNVGTLQLVQTAVTRRCVVDGTAVGEGQKISLTDALKAVTIHAAGQIGMQDRLGSLEPGKEADLTILEGNPYTTDPSKIMEIPVSETWVAGRKMHG